MTTIPTLELDGLPGANLVRRGMADLEAGLRSPEALLVCVAPGRLRKLGLALSTGAGPLPNEPELALYRALGAAGCDDPYYRYNALLREFDSFLEAAAARQRRGTAEG